MAGLDFPIVCPRIVGRDDELAVLESSLLLPRAQRGGAILVSGEAGVGKTRLSDALKERMTVHGWSVIEIACYEQDVQVPFAAFSDLLARLGRQDVLPQQGQGTGPSGEPGGDAAQERSRIVEALHQLLLAFAEDRPCLVLVEDLHWCDSNTLSALLFLARHAQSEAFRILMTLRPDDATADVRGFLAELERERLFSQLRLKPLTLSQTDEMLKVIFNTPRSTSIGVLHRLYQMTEGNPFFIEEVLRSTVHEAAGADPSSIRLDQARIPRTVLEAVGHRLETLSADARAVAEVAAVLGVRFRIADLQAIAMLDEAAVLAALRELLQCQLVTEEDDTTFAFRHALTREAVASRLLRRERAVLHERIARHLESLPDAGDRPEELSYHFFEAGRWDEAQGHAEDAGARALAMFAPAIALEHFQRAIEAASRGGREASSKAYRGRASAFEALGEFVNAEGDLKRAIELAEGQGDLAALTDCLLDMGLLWSSRDYDETLSFYGRAVEVARRLDDPGRLARCLSRLANGLANTGTFDTALNYLQEALEIQRAQQDRHGISETLDLIGMTGLMSGRFHESLSAYREALDLMEPADKRSRISVLASIPVLSGTYQSSMLVPALSLLDARTYAEEAVSLARQLGVPSDLSYALWQYALWLGPQGRYTEAFAAAMESLQLAVETGHKQWETAANGVLGALYCDVLQSREAQAHLRRALECSHEINSPLWAAQMSNFLTDALLLDGRVAEAAALLEAENTAGRDEAAGSMVDVWMLSARAEVEIANSDYNEARRLVDVIGQTRSLGLKLEHLLGIMWMRTSDWDKAFELLLPVATRAGEQGNRSLQWRVLSDLCHCRLQAGQRDQARSFATQALDLIDSLASSLDQPEAFRKAAMLRLPAGMRERAARSEDSVLTAREMEIAGLIAAGMTNREIADALVLSPRTVETHVANAHAKLGFSTRAQLSAWFVEHHPA